MTAALVVVAGETKLMKLREFTRNKVHYTSRFRIMFIKLLGFNAGKPLKYDPHFKGLINSKAR